MTSVIDTKTGIPGNEDKDTPEGAGPKNEKLEIIRREFNDSMVEHIKAYAGNVDFEFSFNVGGWYIDLTEHRINIDPSFFLEKGMNKPEAVFATLHELEHFLDMAQTKFTKRTDAKGNPIMENANYRTYEGLFEYVKNVQKKETASNRGLGKALFRLVNCVDDVLVNRRVMRRWSPGATVAEGLYKKLFPRTDLTADPKHRQLQYALLYEAMMGEAMDVSEDVRDELEKIKGMGLVDIASATDLRGKAQFSAQLRYALLIEKLFPVFEKFYLEDIENKKKKKEEQDKGDENEGEGGEGEESEDKDQSEGEGDPFGDDPFEDAIPDPIDFKDVLEKASKSFKDNKKDEEKKDILLANYNRDLFLVKDVIDRIANSLIEVIVPRRNTRRTFSNPKRDGNYLSSGALATGVAELYGGNLEPAIFIDQEIKVEENFNFPDFDFEVICDVSSSMSENEAILIQRRAVLAFMEAFDEYERRKKLMISRGDISEKQASVFRSAVRVFSDGDKLLKDFDKKIRNNDRVDIHAELARPEGGTSFRSTARNILLSLNDEDIARMRTGDKKRVIIITTDGAFGDLNESRSLISQIVKKADSDNLIFVGIGIGGNARVQDLMSGFGSSFNIESAEDLGKEFVKIIESQVKDKQPQ